VEVVVDRVVKQYGILRQSIRAPNQTGIPVRDLPKVPVSSYSWTTTNHTSKSQKYTKEE
jgi:hypothetical protein